ncbi:hypothetical protein J2Z69_001332 [Paenibacillus shirakamiensis]|uniref:Lipoprotein n=1 Tax=Paenibacillus shirakamiensis TaxID=1265935 RepID=A0ABS4JF27_9BACL|nr:hypothetical protein [Paenibacillus shirakamiensis]MBP2000313.1 hypothetical protein [Paenibacillus shirakamiensis]
MRFISSMWSISGLFVLISLSACSTESIHTNFATEQMDLNKHIRLQTFDTSIASLAYELHPSVTLKQTDDAIHLVYEISVTHPTLSMKDVVVSFTLHPTMTVLLDNVNPVTTTVRTDHATHLEPQGSPKSLNVDREFGFAKSSVKPFFKENLLTLYVKVSYLNHGRVVNDYLKISAVPSKELRNYLVNL